MSEDRAALLAALRLQIEWGADEALEAVPPGLAAARPAGGAGPAAMAEPAAVMREPSARPAARAARPVPPAAEEAAALAARCDSLDALREAMRDFAGSPLRDTATRLVFADGVPGAPVMLVGEAPGADEDRLGRPFVGASGQLLDRMLASIGLDRASNCYISNILPWRPPGNRTPTDAEMLLFLPFIRRHVALARPRLLVLLGGTAAKALLGAKEGITRLRGRWHEVQIEEDKVLTSLATLHPAYLLRSPAAKREAWHDCLMLRRRITEMGIEAEMGLSCPAP